MITDTHAHIYYPEIISNIDEIILRAKDAGVERIIAPAVDLETSELILKLADKHEIIHAALGVHPCDAGKNELSVIEKIEKLLNHEKVVGIGETGLDYYWDTSNIDKQKSFFKLQIELAKSYGLPVIVHTRNSTDDAIEIVKQQYDNNLKGQFHCFSGSENNLEEILRLKNFFVSYCGNITYKNFNQKNIIEKTPVQLILSETDSPFLPPVPYRGKRNEPAFIVNTLLKISEIKNVNFEQLLKSINENVNLLFFKKSE